MKRIVSKIGYIYCAPLNNGFKAYFQYIANDLKQLNSSVIRVFKTHYPISEEPSLETVVSDAVDFYTHTVIRSGVENNVWYKVGKSKDIGLEDFNNIIFGQAECKGLRKDDENNQGQSSSLLIDLNPKENWYVWHLGEENSHFIGRLRKELAEIIEWSAIVPPFAVIQRMIYGFFWGNHPFYDEVRRRPRESVELFTKKVTDDGEFYYHFIGENLQQVIVKTNNVKVLVDSKNPVKEYRHLFNKLFSDYFCRIEDFIKSEDFYAALNL